MPGLDIDGLFSACVSICAGLGEFETIAQHEPDNPPPNGLTCAYWVEDIRPVPRTSGLAATSARVEFSCRIYSNAMTEPKDEVDPAIVRAANAVINAFMGDFTLNNAHGQDLGVYAVDLLGVQGTALSAKAGYVNAADGSVYRVMTVTVPIILNDVWTQAA